MKKDKITFSFGENWRGFLQLYLNEERIQEAKKSLKKFLGLDRLDGLSFLDIGCGSGLFSLSAFKLGAAEILSIDFDHSSVECCKYLKEKEDNPENWRIYQGSIVDELFLKNIESADIVYSWGVLHHTGDMWQAIRNAEKLVKPGGLLFIAIYNKVEGYLGSNTWLALKRTYNRSSKIMKIIIEYLFVLLVVSKMLVTLKNPISEIRNYRKNRGMSFWIDIKDSLGGYPYEYASAEEVLSFCKQELGLKIENMKNVNNLSLNEFLFRKP